MTLLDSNTPLRFALLGSNVQASLSPYLHTRALAALGFAGCYEALSVGNANMATILPKLYAQGFRGINVTIPYKETILQHVCDQDALVQRLGATNTLLWQENGYKAFNTDVWGFEKSLQALPNLDKADIAIFGAGGAAKAVVEVLLTKRVRSIILINRSSVRLEGFKSQVQPTAVLKTYLWEDSYLKSLNRLGGLINASPVRESFPINFTQVQASGFVYDLNYHPEGETAWVVAAKQAGLQGQDGRKMLAAQAAKAMSLWLGRDLESLYELYQSLMLEDAAPVCEA